MPLGSWLPTPLGVAGPCCSLTAEDSRGQVPGFFTKPTEESGVTNSCKPWVLFSTDVNVPEPGNSGKYLGLCVNPSTALSQPELQEKPEPQLLSVRRVLLRPMQKVTILNAYAFPRQIALSRHANKKNHL